MDDIKALMDPQDYEEMQRRFLNEIISDVIDRSWRMEGFPFVWNTEDEC